MRPWIAAISVTACLISSNHLPAAEWGNLTMRFVYDGLPPTPRLLKGPSGHEFADESLIVDPKDRGLANVCIWLVAEDGIEPPVHPQLALAGNLAFSGTILDGRISP